MKVELLTVTPRAESIAMQAAGICVGTEGSLKGLDAALTSGHESIIEHISFTFRINGVSRALLAQLTRHRVASFSVASQRYINQNGFKYVVPESISQRGSTFECMFASQMAMINDWYKAWIDAGIPQEDARAILPNACTTDLILTMNARELRRFFSLRCCNRAQAEIREMANKMLVICKAEAPLLFIDSGAPCVRGACMESTPCRKEQQ